MDYTEKEIELHLIEQGTLHDIGIHFLDSQIRTDFGILDILGLNTKNNKLTVIELKKGVVDENAVGQIMRYISVIMDYLHEMKETSNDVMWAKIEGVEGLLMGTNATPGVYQIVRNFDFLHFIELIVYMGIEPHDYIGQRKQSSILNDANSINKNTDVKNFLEDYYHPEETAKALKSTQQNK